MSKSTSRIFLLFTIASLLVLIGISDVQGFRVNKDGLRTIEGNPVEVETPFDESHDSLVRERREPQRYTGRPPTYSNPLPNK